MADSFHHNLNGVGTAHHQHPHSTHASTEPGHPSQMDSNNSNNTLPPFVAICPPAPSERHGEQPAAVTAPSAPSAPALAPILNKSNAAEPSLPIASHGHSDSNSKSAALSDGPALSQKFRPFVPVDLTTVTPFEAPTGPQRPFGEGQDLSKYGITPSDAETEATEAAQAAKPAQDAPKSVEAPFETISEPPKPTEEPKAEIEALKSYEVPKPVEAFKPAEPKPVEAMNSVEAPNPVDPKPFEALKAATDDTKPIETFKPVEESKPAPIPEPEEPKASEPIKPAGLIPAAKPVEIMSVPDTPVDIGTPLGGTPRPELKITEEPVRAPAEPELPAISQLRESAPVSSSAVTTEPASQTTDSDVEMKDAPSLPIEEAIAPAVEEAAVVPSVPVPEPKAAPEPTASITSAPKSSENVDEPSAGDKRKLDEVEAPVAVAVSEAPKPSDTEPAEKKAKVDEVPAVPLATNGSNDTAAAPTSAPPAEDSASKETTPKKKREKKQPAQPVGRAQRKTRSQGPVETPPTV